MQTPNLQSQSDEQLLALWYEGNAGACEEFFHRYASRFGAFFVKRGVPHDCTDDVLQLGFMRLHKELHRYDPHRAALPWVFVILRNVCYDWLRHQVRDWKRTTELNEDKATGECRSADGHKEVDLDVLQTCIERLTEKQRVLVQLRITEGLSFREIAQRTGKTEVALRKQYQRIVASLREFLNEEEVSHT